VPTLMHCQIVGYFIAYQAFLLPLVLILIESTVSRSFEYEKKKYDIVLIIFVLDMYRICGHKECDNKEMKVSCGTTSDEITNMPMKYHKGNIVFLPVLSYPIYLVNRFTFLAPICRVDAQKELEEHRVLWTTFI
ncbi:hypothetical protein ACJX0J_012497, partial [Zea mays]